MDCEIRNRHTPIRCSAPSSLGSVGVIMQDLLIRPGRLEEGVVGELNRGTFDIRFKSGSCTVGKG